MEVEFKEGWGEEEAKTKGGEEGEGKRKEVGDEGRREERRGIERGEGKG